MQKLINQVYWESASNTYMYGTNLKVALNKHVEFVNTMMSPGKIIIKWQSANNYQMDKVTPQLPLLKSGYTYRINVHASSEPDQTFVTRIVFKNIQGNEIDRVEFKTEQKQFIFPEEAVFYEIYLINSGCSIIRFDRIEICQAVISEEANQDIWIHQPINFDRQQVMNILLIQDEKTARSTTDYLATYANHLFIQPISFVWQTKNTSTNIEDWLIKHSAQQIRFISGMPVMDRIAIKLRKNFSQATALVTNQTDISNNAKIKTYQFLTTNNWYASENVNPDWQHLFKIINNMREEGN